MSEAGNFCSLDKIILDIKSKSKSRSEPYLSSLNCQILLWGAPGRGFLTFKVWCEWKESHGSHGGYLRNHKSLEELPFLHMVSSQEHQDNHQHPTFKRRFSAQSSQQYVVWPCPCCKNWICWHKELVPCESGFRCAVVGVWDQHQWTGMVCFWLCFSRQHWLALPEGWLTSHPGHLL